MKVHIIAIGGSIMHNLALALHNKGYQVTGSDDEIYSPAKERLEEKGLIPKEEGWNKDRIKDDLDIIIVGMHAKKDNPELLEAKLKGKKIFSYPEFIYELSKDKKRVVIGGSHGKTSITSIILQVLNFNQIPCDYLVGAQLKGFDTMVKLTDAPIIIMEGDEYLTSPLDLRPKFHLYHPHIALLSGIAWDHINVFPTYKNYCEQFEIFISLIKKDGCLIYYKKDKDINEILERNDFGIPTIAYTAHDHVIEKGKTSLLAENKQYPIHIFGQHNMENIMGAKEVCTQLGISDNQFYAALQEFQGASKRLDLLAESENNVVYKDFAHSPSKLNATINAVKAQFPSKELVSCMELHTFSSLNKNFLKEYKGTMNNCETAIVFINTKYFEIKGLPPISKQELLDGFDREDLQVYFDSEELNNDLKNKNWKDSNLLLMTSGNFDNLDLNALAQHVIK